MEVMDISLDKFYRMKTKMTFYIFILVNMHFQLSGCVQRKTLNIPIKVGEGWSNSKEKATGIRS